MTIREAYGPAMEVRAKKEADKVFERLIVLVMGFGESREKAEIIVKNNLGYYAGYYDSETRERVERLFNCAHPVFGKIFRLAKNEQEKNEF